MHWFIDRIGNVTDQTAFEYVKSRFSALVDQVEIWIPVANLNIQSDFVFGRISFKSMRSDVIDHWESCHQSQSQKELPKDFWIEQRRRFQGLAAATLLVQAEVGKGVEMALEAANTHVAMLRFLSPENYTPNWHCQTLPLGMEHEESYNALIFKDDMLIHRINHLTIPIANPLQLSDQDIHYWRENGVLCSLSTLLYSSDRSEFQERLFSSMSIYNRSNLFRDPIDKLVFQLVSLESMLSKSETEPIQQNISERLAFVVGTSSDDRRKIIKSVKACYKYRSGFLHHGRSKHDIEVIAEFQKYVWEFFAKMLAQQHEFIGKAEHIDFLEDRKLE